MVPTMVNYRENRPKRQIETPWGRAALNVNQVVSRGLARDAKGTATLGPYQPARGIRRCGRGSGVNCPESERGQHRHR
jgi:hypothetical protein